MSEPTTPVPVSVLVDLLTAPENSTAYAQAASFAARAVEVASQPTPTAEPMRAAQSDDGDRLIEFAERILGVPLDPWQKRLCRRVFGGNVGRSTGSADAAPTPTAEPPRIEDMAPGTVVLDAYSAVCIRDEQGWLRVTPAVHGGQHRHSPFGVLSVLLDPSTIRDVTPPEENL